MVTLHAVPVVGSNGDFAILAKDCHEMLIVGTIVRVNALMFSDIPEHYQVDLMGERLLATTANDVVLARKFTTVGHAIDFIQACYLEAIQALVRDFS